MKKLKLLFLLFLITAASALNAQQKEHTYLPLFGPNKAWYIVENTEYEGFLSDVYTIDSTNFILNVNDTIYYSIGGYYNAYAYYREDTLEQKVYERSSENSPEYLIYDFSLQEGDSINYPYFSQERWFNIDSVVIKSVFNMNRKFYYLRSPNNESYPVWIEGIGSLAGVVFPIDEASLFWCDKGYLTCYYENNVLSYQTYYGNLWGCSFENYPINFEELNSYSYILFPNPITDMSILSFENNSQNAVMTVFDITGKIIFTQSSTNDYFEINRYDFESGIYFFTINVENKTIKGNFLIQ